MAPDGVHHLEGALEDGAFRLYFYDSYTRPIEPDPFGARVVPADDRGAPLGDPVALATAPGALEMPVGAAAGERAAFTAFVQFPDRDDEDRFDFIFLSDAEKAALTAEAAPTALPELRVPDTPQAILDAIRARDRRVQALIDQGRWADLFIPALEAKELALAYGEGASDRPWVALKRIVRGAWLLDLYGDQGDRVRVGEAYEIFAEGCGGCRNGRRSEGQSSEAARADRRGADRPRCRDGCDAGRRSGLVRRRERPRTGTLPLQLLARHPPPPRAALRLLSLGDRPRAGEPDAVPGRAAVGQLHCPAGPPAPDAAMVAGRRHR